MYHYLATSRAQKEKQEPNGVLAHQAALAFPFVCGASRKPRKAEWPFEVPGDRGQKPKKNLPGVLAPQAALAFPFAYGANHKPKSKTKNRAISCADTRDGSRITFLNIANHKPRKTK